MAITTAFVNSCVRSGNNIILTLGDAVTAPTNTFQATFPLEDGPTATGNAVTILLRALNGN